jgi:hypothetical protein
MEDAIFHNQLRQEYEFRMWEQFIKEKEAEENAYDQMAEQYFQDLEKYETAMLEKEYRTLNEWEDLVTV